MKRQMKIAAVVSATALLAIGASFTSMAAAKTGTWKFEDEGWVCYDKDGDLYENVFCLDGGKEYYVGDDGVLVTNDWVEDEDGTYYVGSTGAKTINAWRNVIPEDGEEDDDAEWFYFGSKGVKATGKKVIDGKTYYFDEDGIMLTGWVEYDAENKKAVEAEEYSSDMVYTDENGARVSSAWINTYEPGTDEDDMEDADTYWYWIKSAGAPQTGRNLDINGATYYFGADAKMLSGWVLGTDTNDDTKDDVFEMTTDSNAFAAGNVYFCGNEDQGWSKKNTWVKTWAPEDFEDEDVDVDQYWYWINKNGIVFAAKGDEATAANAVKFVDGELYKTAPKTSNGEMLELKEINNKTYAFNELGQMWSGLVDMADGRFYFGKDSDGAMKTGAVMIADADEYEYKFFFGENDKNGYAEGVAVTGNADGDLYINGQLRTSDEKYEVVPVGDVSYLIDADGDIRSSKKKYYDEDDNLVLDATVDGFEFSDAKGVLKGSF